MLDFLDDGMAGESQSPAEELAELRRQLLSARQNAEQVCLILE